MFKNEFMRVFMRVIILFVVLGLVLVVNQSVQSATTVCPPVAKAVQGGDTIKVHHVSPSPFSPPTGEDWHATIQDAINHADAREPVQIAPGFYKERLMITKSFMRLEGAPGAVLSDSGLSPAEAHIVLSVVTGTQIKFLQVETENSKNALLLKCSPDNLVEDSKFLVEGSANGLTFIDGSSYNSFNRNLIFGNNVERQNRPDRAQVGIYYHAPSVFDGPIVRHNKLKQNTITGFVTGVKYEGSDRNPFYNNIVTGNYIGIDQFWVHAGQIFYSDISNNGDPSTGGGGGLRMRATDSTDTNSNTISNNAGYGISRELTKTPNPFASPESRDIWNDFTNDQSEVNHNTITDNDADVSIQLIFPDNGIRSNDANDDLGRGNEWRNNVVSNGNGNN